MRHDSDDKTGNHSVGTGIVRRIEPMLRPVQEPRG